MVRIDHFRGLVQFWEIPAEERTAIKGKWCDVPTEEFFDTLKRHFPTLPIIAEDLGYITDDVRDSIKRHGFPGMKILMFAFGGEDNNPYLPHNHESNCIVFTGTHDNNTAQGWYEHEATAQEKNHFNRYIKQYNYRDHGSYQREVHWAFISLAMASPAQLALIPLQDIIGLGQEARMNKPATSEGNWQWRLLPEMINSQLINKLTDMTKQAERYPLAKTIPSI